MIDVSVPIDLLVAALTGGAVLRLVDLVGAWRRLTRESEREEARLSWPRAVGAVQTIHETLDALVAGMPEAQRAMVLVAWPHPEGPAYSSVLYESGRVDIGPIRHTWQRARMDAAYLAMLRQVLDVGWTRLETEHLPPGLLRDVYETQGVWGSDVALVADDLPRVLVYLSVTWATEPRGTNTRGRLAAAARAIRHELAPQADLHLAAFTEETDARV